MIKMRRIISVFLAVCLLACLVPAGAVPVFAAAPTSYQIISAVPFSSMAYISAAKEIAYFKFVPEVTTTYIFTSDTNTDTYGYLYNSSGGQIAYNDDGGENRNFLISRELTKGVTYYFGAKFYSETTKGTFKVSLNAPLITAEEVTLPFSGSAQLSGGSKFYKFTPQEGGIYTVSLRNAQSTNANNIKAAIYNSSLSLLDSASSSGNVCSLNPKLTAGSTYYLEMKFSDGSIGTINAEIAPLAAEEITLPFSGSVQLSGGSKFCKFTAQEDGIYTVSLRDAQKTNAKDIKATLYNSSLSRLDWANNNVCSLKSNLTAGSTCYLEMEFSDSSSGTINAEIAPLGSGNLTVTDNVFDVSNDYKYIKFTPAEEGLYTFTVTADSFKNGGSEAADWANYTEVSIVKDEYLEIVASANAVTESSMKASAYLDTYSTYYIRFRTTDESCEGTLRFEFSHTSWPPQTERTIYTESFTDTVELGAGGILFYEISAPPEGADYNFDVSRPSENGKFYLKTYDHYSGKLYESCESYDDGSYQQRATLSFPLSADTRIFAIENAGDAANFTINCSVTAHGGIGPGGEWPPTDASMVWVGSPTSAFLDVDIGKYFTFNSGESGEYTVTVDSAEGYGYPVSVTVYDDSGNPLASGTNTVSCSVSCPGIDMQRAYYIYVCAEYGGEWIINVSYTGGGGGPIENLPSAPSVASADILDGVQIDFSQEDSEDIYYSIGNTDSWSFYFTPLQIYENTTIYYKAQNSAGLSSEVSSYSVILEQCAVPSAAFPSGSYAAGTVISFTPSAPDETVYFTEVGSAPAVFGATPLERDFAVTVFSRALGKRPSARRTYSYTCINIPAPTFSETDIMGGKRVEIAPNLGGTAFTGDIKTYYSTDGENFEEYTEPIDVFDHATVYAYTKVNEMIGQRAEYAVTMQQTAAVVPQYASGEVFKGTTVTLTSDNGGAETEIYYTLDGSDPDMTSTRYTGAITVNENIKIKAAAYALGRAKSDVLSLSYTIRRAKTPKIREEGVRGGKKIYLSCETEGAEIYYSLSGGEEKAETLYTAPFILGKDNTCLTYYAKAGRYLDSEKAQYTFTIEQLTAPTVNISGDKLYTDEKIELSAQDFAEIYYTLGGADVVDENGAVLSGAVKYTEPISPGGDVTLRAAAVAPGWITSGELSRSFTVYKTEAPTVHKKKDGNYIAVELRSETPGAQIYYTLDGSEPSKESTVYSQPIHLEKDTTVKAFAASERRLDSATVTQAVLVRHTAEPRASVPSGTVEKGAKVELFADEGAAIYYTLDGSEPSESSTVYSAAFEIKAPTVIKAFAAKEDYLNSQTVTFTYGVKKAESPSIEFGEDIYGGKSVVITSVTEGADIYYTLDGSEPSVKSKKYTQPIEIFDSASVKAIAVCSGYIDSDVQSAEMYVPAADILAVGKDNEGAVYITAGETIKTVFSENADVYYTLDGSEPTLESSVYKPGELSFSDDTVFRAFAIGNGLKKSATIKLEYLISSIYVSMSAESVDADSDGTVDCALVTLSAPADAVLYFTTNGATPNESSEIYTGEPIVFNQNGKLRVMAVQSGYKTTYKDFDIYMIVAPRPEVVGGIKFTASFRILVQSEEVTLRSDDENVTIYYRLGAEGDWLKYTEPVAIGEDDILYAYSSAENYTASNVINVRRVSDKTVFPFVRENVTDVYGGKMVRLDSLISADRSHYSHTDLPVSGIDGVIHYTLDGSEPSESSPVYTEPILLTDGDILQTLLITNVAKSGIEKSSVCVEKAPEVSFLPGESGVYRGDEARLSAGAPTAKIYYTLDGSDVVLNGDFSGAQKGELYTRPIPINSGVVIKAVAVDMGKAASGQTEHTYSILRVETPGVSEKMTASGKIITLNCGTEGAVIRYTTDGTTPDSSSPVYTEPFKLKKTTVLKFMAQKDKMEDSFIEQQLIAVPYSEMSTVEVGEAEYVSGDTVRVPVRINNNPGISAYTIRLGYDRNYLTPVSAKSGQKGIFVSSVGRETEESGPVSATWLSSGNVYENGELFEVLFSVNNVESETVTAITVSDCGIINQLYETADLALIDGSVTLNKPQRGAEMLAAAQQRQTVYTNTSLNLDVVKLDAETIEATVRVSENSGIGAYNISLNYNTELFTPIEVENGDMFESDVFSNVSRPNADLEHLANISAVSCNDGGTTENGSLFKVRFHINSPVYVEESITFAGAELLSAAGDRLIAETADALVPSGDEKFTVSGVEDADLSDLKVVVYNNSTAEKDAVLIAAVYDSVSRALTDVKKVNVSLKKGRNEISGIGALNSGAAQSVRLGVYLWSSLEDMVPLAMSSASVKAEN